MDEILALLSTEAFQWGALAGALALALAAAVAYGCVRACEWVAARYDVRVSLAVTRRRRTSATTRTAELTWYGSRPAPGAPR